jgi:hypothetical protein
LGESAGTIITEGAYDKYLIDEIDNFEAELRYSGVKFGVLNKKMSIESRYTGVKVLKLSKDFKEVNASLSYGNIFLAVEPGTSYKLEGETKYGSIKVAQEGKLSKKKEGTSMKIWGTVGSSPKSTVSVIAKYGNIEIE